MDYCIENIIISTDQQISNNLKCKLQHSNVLFQAYEFIRVVVNKFHFELILSCKYSLYDMITARDSVLESNDGD